MSAIRITSVNFNNQSANITFYSENNPDIPINLGLHVIPYTRFGNDIFGKYVLNFTSFGTVCEASINSPPITTTPDPSITTTTPDPSVTTTTTTTTTTTVAPGIFSITHDSTSEIMIEFLSGSIGTIDFGDGDSRVFSSNNTITKNYPYFDIKLAERYFESRFISEQQQQRYFLYKDSELFSDVCMSNNGSLIAISCQINNLLADFITDANNVTLLREPRNGGLFINNIYNNTLANLNVTSVTCSNDGSKILASVAGGRTYLSINSGQSFIATDITNRNWKKVRFSNDGSFAVGIAGNEIYISQDGGVNWILSESPRAWTDIAVSSDGSKIVAVGFSNIYISSDFGLNWTPVESHRNWTSVSISDDGSKIIASTSNNIYLTNNGGQSWTNISFTVLGTIISVSMSSDGNFMSCNDSTNVYISYDSGISWSIKPLTNWIQLKSTLTATKLKQSLISKNKNKLIILSTTPFFGQNFSNLNIANLQSSFFTNNTRNYRLYNLELKNINISGQYNFRFKTLNNGFSFVDSNYNPLFTNNNNEKNSGLIKLNSWGSIANLTDVFANKISNSDNNPIGCDGLVTVEIPPNLTNINGLFDGCDSINQDFTGWNISNITNGTLNTLLRNTRLSNTNYNKLLVYFNNNKNSFRDDIVINFGLALSDTSSGGVDGNNAKIGLVIYGWTITDGAGTFSL